MAEAHVELENYFPNRLEKYSSARKLSGQAWCDLREYADIWMEILQEQIVFEQKQTNKLGMRMNGTVYSGTAGLAYLDIYLAKTFEMSDCDRELLLKRAAIMLEVSLKKIKGCRMSFIGGDAGPLAMTIVMYSDMVSQGCRCEAEVAHYLCKLLAFKGPATAPYMDHPADVVCGRAGYLWSLLYVNKHYPNLIDPDIITDVVIAIVRAGKPCNGKQRSHLMYKWKGKELLGAAHGLFGILYVLLKAKDYWPRDETVGCVHPEKMTVEERLEVQKIMFNKQETLCNEQVNKWVLQTLHFLTCQIFASGNTLLALGSATDKYVTWANGAAGAIYTFIEAHKVYRHPHFLTAARNCAEIIWHRGLVKKGYSLADGVAGNAYALMALYKYTRCEVYRKQAMMLATYCFNYGAADDPCHNPSDHPLSLYEGLAGVIYMFYDFTTTEPKFPGYEL